MNLKTRVLVVSHDRARRVDALGAGEYGAREIERGEGAIGGAQEAVNPEACFFVASRDRARRVDALGDGAGGARGIERGEGAVGSAKEAVPPKTRVCVGSRNRPRRVDARRAGPKNSARSVERGEGAVGSAKEAMVPKTREVGSCDRPLTGGNVTLVTTECEKSFPFVLFDVGWGRAQKRRFLFLSSV